MKMPLNWVELASQEFGSQDSRTTWLLSVRMRMAALAMCVADSRYVVFVLGFVLSEEEEAWWSSTRAPRITP